MKTLTLLETGKLKHVPDTGRQYLGDAVEFSGHFNMDQWAFKHECGTIACIGGTAELVGHLKRDELDYASNTNRPLHNLFYPAGLTGLSWGHITPAQAAVALRSYLTTGDARWDVAIAS